MLGTAQELGMLGIVSKSGVVFSKLEDGGLTSLSGDVGPDWIGNLLGCFLKSEKTKCNKTQKCTDLGHSVEISEFFWHSDFM